MRASTPEKAFLRFLYLMDRYYALLGQSTEFSYTDVVLMANKADPKDEYGFSSFLEDSCQARVISVSQSLSLIKFKKDEQRILAQITELGKGFASQLSFPDELEEKLKEFFGGENNEL